MCVYLLHVKPNEKTLQKLIIYVHHHTLVYTLMAACMDGYIYVRLDTCNIIKAPYFHSYNRYFMSHMPKHQNYWFTSNCTVQHKSSLFSCLLPISLFIDNYGKIAKIFYFFWDDIKIWEWNYIFGFHHYI